MEPFIHVVITHIDGTTIDLSYTDMYNALNRVADWMSHNPEVELESITFTLDE